MTSPIPPRPRPLARTVAGVLAGVVAATAATACLDERSSRWERDRRVIGPIPLGDRMAYVDAARDLVVVVDLEGGTPRTRAAAIGRDAVFAVATPDHGGLAVLTRGEEALAEGQVDELPALWLLDAGPDRGSDATPRSYPIGSPFDRLAIAADGSLAVASFSADGAGDDPGVFRNPSELAVVDLAGEGVDAVVLRTVRSFGAAPDGVLLSPPIVLPGAADPTPRIFAFVLAEDTLTILDATHPERREVTLRLGGTGEEVRPQEIVFAPAAATAYVRSQGARDVLAVRLTGEAPDPAVPLDNDFDATASELGAGAGPADVAVYDDAGGTRFVLAAMPSIGQIAVIDADTAAFVTIPTPDPVDRILLFGDGPDGPPHTALLASLARPVPRVHLLALTGVDDPLVPTDLRTAPLAAPVLDVVPVPGGGRAMVVHDDDRTVLGLLDLALGAVSPLEGVGRLDSFAFTADGRFLVGATEGADRLGLLELATLHPSDVRLDAAPGRVLALPGGGVYVDHGDPFGHATWLPTAEATRAEATVIHGFLLHDLLDEEG